MMMVQELPIASIDISEFNTRKALSDGEFSDSSIDELAASIERQGLLQPITVRTQEGGRYAVLAGQRRLLACRHLGRETIEAFVRDDIDDEHAITVSLIENLHREDMNPRDKAAALGALRDSFDGDLKRVQHETGLSRKTVRKYIDLLDLAPALQERLAAGEARNTEALARLAQLFDDYESQVIVWNRIKDFTQEVQQDILRRLTTDLDNLDELVEQAVEGRLGYRIVRNCPFDCAAIPSAVKDEVARLIDSADGA